MDPILLTGCPRSGMGLLTGIFSACGLFMGDACDTTSPSELHDSILEPYLKSINADPNGGLPLPVQLPPRPWLSLDAKQMVKDQGWEEGRYGLCDPKLAITWKIWAQAFPRARWIITVRDRESVHASCDSGLYMKQLATKQAWLKWFFHHDKCFTRIKKSCSYVRFVNTRDIAMGDFTTIQKIVGWCGLKWNQEAVEAFVDSSLWHHGRR